MTMGSDIRLNCPMGILRTTAMQHFQSPIYRYVVTAWPSKPTTVIGFDFPASYAFHCLDLLAFFDTLQNTVNPLSHGDVQFQNNLRNTMLSFVKNGEPSACWQRFQNTTAMISHRITFVTQYKHHECTFWLDNDMFKYGWVN